MKKYLLLIIVVFIIGCLEPTTYREKEISITDQKQIDPEVPAIVPLLKCE
ncbi:MAG: hypothetical protein J7L15_06315 [Clostridiales bacterium]|nr:hypothetical protein [Clostridiales bacterium]